MSLWGKIFGLEKNPEYERGIKHFNDGEYELAVESLEKAVKEVGRNDPTYALGMFYAAESHAHIGTAKFHAGDLEGALEHFKKALEENPTYPDLYYRLGVIRHQMGEEDMAVEMLQRAIELNNGYFEAVCYLGIVLYEKGMKEEAEKYFKRALEIGADTPSPISKFLSCHLCGRETDIPPLSELKELMRTDSDFDACVKEGVEAYNTGSFERAIMAFREALSIHPDYADMRFKLGLSLLRNGEHESARDELNKALEINPDYTEARFYLGVAYLREGNLEEAMVVLKDILEAGGESADVLYFIGEVYLRTGKLEEAEDYFRKSLGSNPKFLRAREKLALIMLKKGDYQEAERILGADDVAFADLHKIMGDIMFYKGDLDSAEERYRKSLAVNSEYGGASLSLALTLRKKGLGNEADEELKRLLAYDPENVVARNLLGRGPFDLDS